MLICSRIFVYDDECNKVNFLISAALCSELISPINGKVTWTGLTSGSTATYTCDSGYELDGYQNRTCRITGTWTRYTPYCRRMKHTQINRNYITSTLHAHRKKCVHDSTLNNAQICILTSQIIQVCTKQCSL